MGSDYGFKRKGWTLSIYPFTFFLIIIWATFTGGLIWLLEYAVSRSTIDADQPWWITDLPTILLTVFAQGHGALTAMYLARLAISALQHPKTAPNSWAELFWLADRNWQGPFGLTATLLGQARLRNVSLSSTFVLFTITCFFALPTPIALSKTYQVRTVTVNARNIITTNAIVPETLTTFNHFSQRSAGAGAWGMGMPVAQVYNATTYVPVKFADDRDGVLDEVIFAGQLGDKDANMTAIRMAGDCQVIQPDSSDLPTYEEGDWFKWCQRRDPEMKSWDESELTNAWNVNLTVYWCTSNNLTDPYWTLDPELATAHALVWVNSTDTDNSQYGFIECNSTFEIGSADLRGLGGIFRSFKAHTPYNASAIATGTSFRHPMTAALSELTLLWSKSEISTERGISLLKMYGFEANFDMFKGTHWTMPSLDGFALNIWGGALHMGASVGALARRAGQRVEAVEHREHSGRQRATYWGFVTVGLLAGWAGMLAICTVRMFRPTFGSSLDSYAAARLLVDVPFLVDEHCCGELEVNGNLRAGFKRVGDVDPDGITGHIGSGGAGVLIRRREYS